MFDLINVVGETETPKGQRICKVFGFEWRKTFCTPWSGLKLGENSRKIFFICESVEDLVRWCYPDILSLLFQYTFRKAIAPKIHAVNHIHILALSLMISEFFIFESADSEKSGEQAGSFAVEYLYSTSASGLPIQTLPTEVVESHVLQQAVLQWPDLCCFNSKQVFQKTFSWIWSKLRETDR